MMPKNAVEHVCHVHILMNTINRDGDDIYFLAKKKGLCISGIRGKRKIYNVLFKLVDTFTASQHVFDVAFLRAIPVLINNCKWSNDRFEILLKLPITSIAK